MVYPFGRTLATVTPYRVAGKLSSGERKPTAGGNRRKSTRETKFRIDATAAAVAGQDCQHR
jgi:hypothetical protein